MTMTSRGRARVSVPILLVSAVTWVMLLINPGSIMTVAHCPVTDSGASMVSLRMLLEMNPISSLMAGWAMMLVAMMSPTLIAPLRHILDRCFKRRSLRSVTFFVVGYAAIWMAAGAGLIAVMLIVNMLAPQSYLAAVVVGIIALVWQCSPLKQRCLNRCHNHGELAAFGMAADLGTLRFGITHGVWCVGSCWLLMLLPMLLGQGHSAAMAVVTFVITSERLDRPRPLNWRLRVPSRLMRIVVAQARIRLPRFG